MLTFMLILNFMCLLANMSLIKMPSPTMMLPILIFIFITLATMIWSLNSFWNWTAYTIFLVFVGGLLILMSYIISLIPNTKLSYNPTKNMSMMLFVGFLVITSMYLLDTPTINVHNFSEQSSFSTQATSNMLYLFMFSSITHTSLLMLLLFFVMIIVTMLSKTSYGSMRKT